MIMVDGINKHSLLAVRLWCWCILILLCKECMQVVNFIKPIIVKTDICFPKDEKKWGWDAVGKVAVKQSKEITYSWSSYWNCPRQKFWLDWSTRLKGQLTLFHWLQNHFTKRIKNFSPKLLHSTPLSRKSSGEKSCAIFLIEIE